MDHISQPQPTAAEKKLDQEVMKEIKEIQETILPTISDNEHVTEEEFANVLKMVAPGTQFRSALDGALKAGKGALIVLENERVLPVIDGGFKLNCRFTPQRLVELCKMDGAIVLSKDGKKINYANVLLTPDSKVKTMETGTRHKAAERTAKNTQSLVIAISERKHEISIFYKGMKYHLKNTDEVLRKANEHLQMLEKHRELFDKYVDKLNLLELRNYPNVQQACLVLQKGRMIQKISSDVRKSIIELGSEGTLLKSRLKEISYGVDKETNLVLRDYTRLDVKKSRTLLESLSYDEILDQDNILRALAYETQPEAMPIKGWRILSKTGLSDEEINAVMKAFGTLGKILHSNMKEYMNILGDQQGFVAKEEIDKLKIHN
jgi:diadenylate cyclase